MLKLNRSFYWFKTCYLSSFRSFAHKESPAENTFHLVKSHIDEASKLQPFLSSVSLELWEKSHGIFLNQGFRTVDFLQIVTEYPNLISRSDIKIGQSLETWRSCQFGEFKVQQLITKYPNLLDLSDERQLIRRTTFLREFVGSLSNVWKLLMSSPNLIQDNPEIIKKKFDYLQNEMRIEIPEIVKSEVFSLDLQEIQCRHIFLERLGLFKPRPLKADPNERSKNPKLYQIMDTSDKRFATKIAHVTLEEYEVFKELFNRELERKYDDNTDDEYD